MQAQTQGAPAPTILPTSINWICYGGIVLHYERSSAEDLTSSGLVDAFEMPESRYKKSRGGALRISTNKDGTFNARIDADSVLARDVGFKRFLGGLMADTRLSLVKGESHVG